MCFKMYFLIMLSLICLVECKIEYLISGGQVAQIRQFPHSAFLHARSHKKEDSVWGCGSSIINQRTLLTAAHCVISCWNQNTMSITMGHNDKTQGAVSSVQSFIMHDKYISGKAYCDIALIRLKTDLKLGLDVRRVALMQKPPRFKKAQVAGWGVVDDKTQNTSDTQTLQYIDQYLWNRTECKKDFGMPKGVLCASVKRGASHTSGGDSGSALVVRGYIQIGIVSYAMSMVSKIMAMYTDTCYFYTWIVKTAKKLHCDIEQ